MTCSNCFREAAAAPFVRLELVDVCAECRALPEIVALLTLVDELERELLERSTPLGSHPA
jgi:hypothetical protein